MKLEVTMRALALGVEFIRQQLAATRAARYHPLAGHLRCFGSERFGFGPGPFLFWRPARVHVAALSIFSIHRRGEALFLRAIQGADVVHESLNLRGGEFVAPRGHGGTLHAVGDDASDLGV